MLRAKNIRPLPCRQAGMSGRYLNLPASSRLRQQSVNIELTGRAHVNPPVGDGRHPELHTKPVVVPVLLYSCTLRLSASNA